ncbi:hypothetical protein GM524_13355, partial [Streptococcus pneumoniae]|uniref:hypothetical protein n=1 Tax=Streptococcus pneumoniae TaxID=1313 RepID=UPI0012D78EFA
MKHLYISLAKSAFVLTILFLGTLVHAQVAVSPELFDQNGKVVDGYDTTANSLVAGWYYTQTGVP